MAGAVAGYKPGEFVALMIHLGDRLGPYKALTGAGCCLALLLAAGVSQASTLEVSGSVFGLRIGALPPVTIGQSPDPVAILVSTGTGGFVVPAGVLAGTATLPTSLFTGISLFTDLFVSISQLTGTFAQGGGPGGGFGGPGPVMGIAALEVLGSLVNLIIPLSVVGQGGVQQAGAAALMITITGARWTTGAAVVTAVTTKTVGGALTNTVTVSGYDNRSAGHAGRLQLVTPIRILINAAGNLPAFATQVLHFVPEPGLPLLIGSAAAGLAILGYRRRRK